MPKQSADHGDGQPVTPNAFQRLERLEAELEGNAHTGHNRWMVPYADLLTLLLGLFLVIFTSGQAQPKAQPKSTPATVAQAPAKQPIADSASKQLKEKLNMKGVEIRQQRTGLVISLKDSILFGPGKAELSPQAKQTLDRVMQELQDSMGPELHSIREEGHTDDTPIHTAEFPSNWELSTARATSIVRYLVMSHQFPPESLSASGFAEFKPLSDNSTIEGKQKNRRVDIVVLRPSAASPVSPKQHSPRLAATSGSHSVLE